MSDNSNEPNPAELKRELGVFSAMMLGLGSILGTGVFVSLGLGADVAGNTVIPAVGCAAILAICNGMSSAQLAANHPVSGGRVAKKLKRADGPPKYELGPSDPNVYKTTLGFGWRLTWITWEHSWNQAAACNARGASRRNPREENSL